MRKAAKELIEAGKLTPVVDRTLALSGIPEAIGYVGERSIQGKTASVELTAGARGAAPDCAWNGVHHGDRTHPQEQGPGPSVPP